MSSAVTVPSGSGPAIQFKDVRIGFDEGDIFRGVSFRVEPRETMILLGETGTGKTLTLKLAAGRLDPITSQTIITLILRLRDVYGVTALLATHRLQDGFALANFHFDAETKRVVANAHNGNAAWAARSGRTRFLVYRDGGIYFEGEPEEIVNSKDPYLKRFLV